MASVGVFSFSSLGAMLKAADQIFLSPELELIEATPLSGYGQVIVTGEAQKISNLTQAMGPDDLLKSKVIVEAHPQLLKAYYSLDNAVVEKTLVVLESEDLGSLLEACNEALKDSWKIVDLRWPKGKASSGYAFLTSTDRDIPKATSELKVTSLSPVSEGLRSYLNIDL